MWHLLKPLREKIKVTAIKTEHGTIYQDAQLLDKLTIEDVLPGLSKHINALSRSEKATYSETRAFDCTSQRGDSSYIVFT